MIKARSATFGRGKLTRSTVVPPPTITGIMMGSCIPSHLTPAFLPIGLVPVYLFVRYLVSIPAITLHSYIWISVSHSNYHPQALWTIDLYPIAAMSYVALNPYMSNTCFLYLHLLGTSMYLYPIPSITLNPDGIYLIIVISTE